MANPDKPSGARQGKDEGTDKDPPPPGREQREYPHGSGDRNAWSPFGKARMPKHEGGTQREAPPEPDRGK